MGQDVTTCSSVCSFASHSQAAIEPIPHLCVFERNRPMSVRKRFSLPYTGLGKLITGGVKLTLLIIVWSGEVLSRHFMLHLYSAHCATLISDWAKLLSSFNAADTNGCLDLSFPQLSTKWRQSLSYRRYSGS